MKITLTTLLLSAFFVGAASAGIGVSIPIAFTNSGNNTLILDRLADHGGLTVVDVGNFPKNVTFTPDGEHVYVVNFEATQPTPPVNPPIKTGSVTVIRVSDAEVVATVDVGIEPFGIAATPDGELVYVTNTFDNTLSIIQTSDNTVVSTVPSGGMGPTGIAITSDGELVYIANSLSNNVTVLQTSDNTVIHTLPIGAAPIGVAITPGTRNVWVANSQDNTVTWIDEFTVKGTQDLGGEVPIAIAAAVPTDPTSGRSGWVFVANSNSNNANLFQGTSGFQSNFGGVGLGGVNPVSVAVCGSGNYVQAVVVNEVSNSATFLSECIQPFPQQNEPATCETDNPQYGSQFGLDSPTAVAVWCPDTDGDGVPNATDTDSDNDGITDDDETSGGSASVASTISLQNQDSIDPDGDGRANSLDIDSDGDGIPDHIEGGGNNDMNADGIADGFVDSDGDGHHDAHDPTQGGTLLPLPDTDGDGVPNFLDRDSDNDGISDSNETIGCIDADNDGILDNSEDANNDGLADSVHPQTGAPCVLLDIDEDGLPDHLDADSGVGGSSCSMAPSTASNTPFTVYLLIPAFILIVRLWRRKTNDKQN